MSDVFDKKTRSRVMQTIKSKKNKSTELRLVKLFKENGISGWRRSYPVKGHPDFAFPGKRVVVFVDGCFWHGHDCRNTKPKDNEEYWAKKIAENREHDAKITRLFQARGWTVIRIWECQLTKTRAAGTIARVLAALE